MNLDEKKFNKWFNAFVLLGMTVCVVLSCILKLQDPEARKVLLIVSSFGAVMGVVSTVLSANGSIWTFLFGLIDVCIYAYILYDSKMPTQFLLHAFYFVPMEFVGFFQWRKRGADSHQAVKAQRLKGIKWIWYILLFIGVFSAAMAISYLISTKAGEAMDWSKMALDAFATTSNIVALVMMAFAYMEQWYLWNLVNISSIILWAITLASSPESSYAIIPLVKYSFYLINGINGIRIWLALSKTDEGGAVLEK